MAFQGYLKPDEVNLLVQAAVESGLVAASRDVRTQGMSAGFVLSIAFGQSALDQFLYELLALNRVERLLTGDVPLVLFLENCARYLRLRSLPSAEIFERTASTLGNKTRGVKGLPDLATLPEIVTPEAIVGHDDMVDFEFLALAQVTGKSVARILVPRFDAGAPKFIAPGEPWVMSGTAWTIGPGLMITNHHVINARNSDEPAAPNEDLDKQATNAVLEFDFDTPKAARNTQQVTELVVADTALDYAILGMNPAVTREVLKLSEQRLLSGPTTWTSVNIIQHPRGEYKRIAMRNNIVSGTTLTEIRYFTDTDFGSSGSPVCDDYWRVVGLHRGACRTENVNFQGKDTAYVNFGSQLVAILEDINQRRPDIGTVIRQAQHS